MLINLSMSAFNNHDISTRTKRDYFKTTGYSEVKSMPKISPSQIKQELQRGEACEKNDVFMEKNDDWCPPLLAIITESDAVSSRLRMDETINTLCQVMRDGSVDLISIRCIQNDDKNESKDFVERVIELTKKLLAYRRELSTSSTKYSVKRLPKIVINDNLDAVLASNADGIHVKERNVSDIPLIRETLDNLYNVNHNDDEVRTPKLIGTSAHSTNSAKHAVSQGKIDYLFVGTCYLTQSHPEKICEDDLEGPHLPGLIRQTLLSDMNSRKTDVEKIPSIFAIGGINDVNCWEPVEKGADGVALIRSVMQANNPVAASNFIYQRMKEGKVI